MNQQLQRNIASDTTIICNSIPPYRATITNNNNTINNIKITDYSRRYVEYYMKCTTGDSLLLLIPQLYIVKKTHGSI